MIPFWKTNVFANKWLIMAVTLGFFLQVLPFMSPLLRDFFGVSSLGYLHWLAAIAASVIMFVIVEIFKVVYHPHHIYTESQ
jgi:magnesium-transporting ATPase (P-type)